MTGTITAAIVSLISKVDRKAQEPERAPSVLLGTMVVCYISAAALGAALAYGHTTLSGLLPLAAVGIVRLKALRPSPAGDEPISFE
jgi:hypothetical protein